MLTTQKTIVCISNTFQYDHVQITGRSRRRRSSPTVTFAKKRDFAENSTSKNQTSIISSLKISKKLLAQSAIAVFALGFTDAGYSGDWSRIGVISKENEDLLKSAAFLVVPLCFFLIVSFNYKKFED
ncbi:hypothetical protein M9H77_06720 [Catharanthus roseus]|uniref:Uncharacterized protein n=1 Tax=Catharanthus roseus TaxID=4058 RepID=A0ACC0BSV5_CATRO|nr:hypothetical protein M9H77_06720 [Catharanthus roseus]